MTPNVRPITHRILCAMARVELERTPTLTDGEWVERVKRRLVAQRFAYPAPHGLTAAIRAVEHVREKTGRRRA
jgi:hypothetical protein